MKKQISAKIIADSTGINGSRIVTFILTYPRFIHAEVMTHRMFTRNAASSRAIPFPKMVDRVREDPFIPYVWQKHHTGMQGKEYFMTPGEIESLESNWEDAARFAEADAEALYDMGVTKQICNRILEPFLWYTSLVTATEFDNFFDLRLPKYVINGKTYKSKTEAMDDLPYVAFKDWNEAEWMAHSEAAAEPHMQLLAEEMYEAMKRSTPVVLKPGEWHMPFGDRVTDEDIDKAFENTKCLYTYDGTRKKVAVARCARLSYLTYDGEFDILKDVKLANQLLLNKHLSPFEHIAKAMSKEEWGDNRVYEYGWIKTGWMKNFRGFMSYRSLLEAEEK